MPAPTFIGLALVLAVAAPAWASPARDRLERFREIAAARLSVAEDTGVALDPASQAEMDALLDGEVLDSLRVGGPFASVGFIRERLDASAEAWGPASLHIDPLAGGLLAGRFRLSAKGVSNSMRLYGSAKGKPVLLGAWQEDGVPEVYPWAVPAGGGAEILVSRSGTATGWGNWPLRLELCCDVQAEQEDLDRADPGGGLTLVSRQLFNGWHRELQRPAPRFFFALASGDRKALAELAPDVALRGGRPVRAVVALAEPRAVRPAPDRRSPRATMTGYHG